MPKPSRTEDALARIREIRDSPESHDLKRELAPFLTHKSNHVIAAAATAVKRMEYAQLTPELIAAFLEILPKASDRDQGCKALISIAEALVTMGEDAPDVYLKGVRHVQREGSFGPPVDVASPLRGLCARGLVRMRHPEALYLAIDTLTDSEPAARMGAVQALADAGSREAELLLRLKARQGDREGDVTGACFSALLSISPGRSLEFVGKYLGAGVTSEEVEAAALALGEARIAGALPLLIEAWTAHRNQAVRRTILLAMAMLRSEEAVEFLLTRLKQDPALPAQDALDALSIYSSDEAIGVRIREIVERRKLPLNAAR